MLLGIQMRTALSKQNDIIINTATFTTQNQQPHANFYTRIIQTT